MDHNGACTLENDSAECAKPITSKTALLDSEYLNDVLGMIVNFHHVLSK